MSLENEQSVGTSEILINQWDVGEGRLRPRRVPKVPANELAKKIKCDICQKFFRAAYIEVDREKYSAIQ